VLSILSLILNLVKHKCIQFLLVCNSLSESLSSAQVELFTNPDKEVKIGHLFLIQLEILDFGEVVAHVTLIDFKTVYLGELGVFELVLGHARLSRVEVDNEPLGSELSHFLVL